MAEHAARFHDGVETRVVDSGDSAFHPQVWRRCFGKICMPASELKQGKVVLGARISCERTVDELREEQVSLTEEVDDGLFHHACDRSCNA